MVRGDLMHSMRPHVLAMGLASETELDELAATACTHLADPVRGHLSVAGGLLVFAVVPPGQGGVSGRGVRWWWRMNPIEKAICRVDNVQQRHKATAFVVGMVKKYGTTTAGYWSLTWPTQDSFPVSAASGAGDLARLSRIQ
jgi:hypothetical protein